MESRFTLRYMWYAVAFVGAFVVLAFVNFSAYDPQNELGVFAPRADAMFESDLSAPDFDMPDFDDADWSDETATSESSSYQKCTISANTSAVEYGGSVTLSWATEGYSDVTINGTSVTPGNGTKTYENITETDVFKLVATTEDGEHDCTATVKVICIPESAPAPVCELDAVPSTITKGDSAELQWSTEDATSATLDQGIGSVATGAEHSTAVTPSDTTTYTMTVKNKDGKEATCTSTVTVQDEPEPKQPKCEAFGAHPQWIKKGESSTLTWETKHAEKIAINQGIGYVTDKDKQVVSPLETTTYTLTVFGKNHTKDTCTTTVTVKKPETKLPHCVMSASPSTIDSDESSELKWTTSNAVTAKINQGIGSVATGTNVTREVSPNQDRTYTMTVANAQGDEKTCAATVNVTPDPDPITCEDDVSFSSDHDWIYRGQETTLDWNTSGGITDVSINRGIGDVDTDGSTDVSPRTTTTYTLTASDGTDTISCPTTVEVRNPGGGGGGGGRVSPQCELSISDSRIEAGDRVTLTWDERHASDIEITDGDDDVIVTTHDRLFDAKQDLLSGSRTLTPRESTTYTMVAERGNRTDECTVRVTVEGDDIIVQEQRDQQPLVSGISLSQVPYTGFAAGPMLTMLFYTLLTVWALFVAYVYVRRRQAYAGAPIMAPSCAIPESYQRFQQPTAYTATAATAEATVPDNLPVATEATVAPQAAQPVETGGTPPVWESTKVALEEQAHAKRILISDDAIAHFVADTPTGNVTELFDVVLDYAAATYPAEEGWVVINLPRMQTLLRQ